MVNIFALRKKAISEKSIPDINNIIKKYRVLCKTPHGYLVSDIGTFPTRKVVHLKACHYIFFDTYTEALNNLGRQALEFFLIINTKAKKMEEFMVTLNELNHNIKNLRKGKE